jgi:hypothetical protein
LCGKYFKTEKVVTCGALILNRWRVYLFLVNIFELAVIITDYIRQGNMHVSLPGYLPTNAFFVCG